MKRLCKFKHDFQIVKGRKTVSVSLIFFNLALKKLQEELGLKTKQLNIVYIYPLIVLFQIIPIFLGYDESVFKLGFSIVGSVVKYLFLTIMTGKALRISSNILKVYEPILNEGIRDCLWCGHPLPPDSQKCIYCGNINEPSPKYSKDHSKEKPDIK